MITDIAKPLAEKINEDIPGDVKIVILNDQILDWKRQLCHRNLLHLIAVGQGQTTEEVLGITAQAIECMKALDVLYDLAQRVGKEPASPKDAAVADTDKLLILEQLIVLYKNTRYSLQLEHLVKQSVTPHDTSVFDEIERRIEQCVRALAVLYTEKDQLGDTH